MTSRSGTLLSAAPTSTTIGPGFPVAAFDVGGTDIKSAVFDASGSMLGINRTPTPPAGVDTPSAVLTRLTDLRRDSAAAFPDVAPRSVGIVVPGLVDDTLGVARHSTNLGWNDVPFKSLSEDHLNLPVGFSQDVRAAGMAEFRLGAARPFRDVNVIVIGTGIAGTLFIDGRVHAAGGYAGEIGHAIVDASGPECSCGARGCLEAVASAGSIARRYAALTGTQPSGAKDVLERVRGGDQTAHFVWSQAVDALAISLAQQTAIIAPEAFVIGGGLAQAGEALFVPLERRLDELLSYHRRPRLLPAQLGENAGLIGAALLARDRLEFA